MDQRVQGIIKLMESDFARHFSEDDLARAVNLSPWRLCHLFKRETGVSPLHYLKSLRMENAKNLLETTFFSVKQIMKMVGITDESHFVRDFQRVYGFSPLAHRLRTAVAAETAKLANK
jgi:AraC family transcriptional regulator, transcriptional activator for feuABC-ybbA operon